MIEQVAVKLAENMWVIVAMFLVVVVWAFLQAAIKVLRDMFLVKFFKKKLNGNGHKNNGSMEAKFDELIQVNTEIGEKHDSRMASIEGKIGAMHDIVCETDENKFPKLRVMEKRMKEVWDRVVRKVNGND